MLLSKGWKIVCSLSVALALMILVPGGAAAQPGTSCDDSARAAFAAAVASGATDQELEDQFGHCRTAYTEPPCSPEPGDDAGLASVTGEIRSVVAPVKSVVNSNIFYERMNGCGYHPQAELLACDVEIRRLTGYGGFPGGSNEFVRFCMDCDRNGTWDFTTVGSVHVTNNVAAGPVPSWYHLAYGWSTSAPNFCTANNGGQANVRAILSWAAVPANCNSVPFWGNIINFTARRDP